jgi:hypothetical protein
MSGVTIENGVVNISGVGIYNQGTLTVSNSILSGNAAPIFGGGIYNDRTGTLTVIDSTLSGNWAGYPFCNLGQAVGGGIYNSGAATVIHSTLSGNYTVSCQAVTDYGGGIYNAGGTLTVIDSVLSGNVAGTFNPGFTGTGGIGGAIYNNGPLTLINSTLSSNSGGVGGGIWNASTATVSNSTLFGNYGTEYTLQFGIINTQTGTLTVSNSTLSGNNGGIDNFGTLILKATLLAGQTGGNGNCVGTITSDGYNLDDDGTCGLNQTGDQSTVSTAASFLGPLQNNGGPTQTIALLPGSTAIDAIPVNACTDASGNPVTTDQRGVTRPQGAGCDIGAFEAAAPMPAANVCPNGQSTPAPCSYAITLNYYIPSGTTLGSNPVQVVTQGAASLDFTLASTTCGGLTGPANCSVNVTFAPLAPGVRMGAVSLTDSSANPVASHQIYGIGQGPAVAFAPGTQTAVGSGWNQPYGGVAVDAAGDVFVSDAGSNNQVVEIRAGGGAQTTVGSGLNVPSGVAVDGAGDVFIADVRNNRVVEVPAGCTSATCQTTVGSGLNNPFGVAVDAAGNVFISDSGNNRVVKVPAGCTSATCQTTVGSGLNAPFGVAVDGAGDVFIADNGNSRVVEVPAGCTSATCQTMVGSGLSHPTGVAVDAAGSVFIADFSQSSVVEVPAGCTTAACQTTVGSGLNGPTAVTVEWSRRCLHRRYRQRPGGGGEPHAAALVDLREYGCGPNQQRQPAVGRHAKHWQPTFACCQPRPGLHRTELHSGGGFRHARRLRCRLLRRATGAGSHLQCQHQLRAADGGQSSHQHRCLHRQRAQRQSVRQPGHQPARRRHAGAANHRIHPAAHRDGADLCHTGGYRNFQLAGNLNLLYPECVLCYRHHRAISDGGTCTIVATQPGNATYQAAPPVTQSTTVMPAPQTITFTRFPASQLQGTSLTLSATASSKLPVTFASLTPSICNVLGNAATLAHPGTCTIQASQSGNAVYAAAPPVSQSLAVVAAFTITPTPSSETVYRGDIAAFVLELQAASGFTGNVTLSCSGGPSGSSCVSLPMTVPFKNGKALAISGIFFPKSTAPGTYIVTFTSTSGSITDTATATFIVKAH